MSDVTKILTDLEGGHNDSSAEKLLPLVYDELRKLADAKLSNEKPGQTIQATGLVHEAWMRLLGTDAEIHWNGRGHFFAAAAKAMQRILIEAARRKKSLKRGGEYGRAELTCDLIADSGNQMDIIELSDALAVLEQQDQRKAELVRLRFFAGLKMSEAARALGVSLSTADNDWAYAKAWLKVEMGNKL